MNGRSATRMCACIRPCAVVVRESFRARRWTSSLPRPHAPISGAAEHRKTQPQFSDAILVGIARRLPALRTRRFSSAGPKLPGTWRPAFRRPERSGISPPLACPSPAIEGRGPWWPRTVTRSPPGAWLRTTPAGAAFLAPPAERLRKAPRMSQDKMNIILYSHLSTTHGRKSARLLL
jgi:hypothetical protein